MSQDIQFACDCSASHYSGCPPSNNLVMTPDGKTELKGARLQITPQDGVPVANQASAACQQYCTTNCDTIKTTEDTVGYSKRAIYDALGWDMQDVAPYERWALVGPTIVPQDTSLAYTLLAMLFVIFAIWAGVHSIVRSEGQGRSSIHRVINAIVAAYFGPIYLAIASIAGRRAPDALVVADPAGQPTKSGSSSGYNMVLGGLAAVVGILLVLMFTGVIHVTPEPTVFCPPGYEVNDDQTECRKKKI